MMNKTFGEVISLAFVGNPNCGKTTLFNALTGSNIKVGNWPGVTVQKIEGEIGYQNCLLRMIDLPGVYSLNSFTSEEEITSSCLANDDIDIIVNIVDGTVLERHLFLTLQLLQLNKPMILVLNMMDLVEKKGIFLDCHELSNQLGKIPVLATSAVNKTGLGGLLDKIIEINHQGIKNNYRNDDVSYQKINRIIKRCWKPSIQVKDYTDIIDVILLHRLWGIPVFLGIMAVVFWFTFVVGDWIKEFMQNGLNWFTMFIQGAMEAHAISPWLTSLIIEGVIAGVGVVITFLPNLLVLFIAMGIMEDCGYMARVAYVMNELMNSIGMSGKAFIPVILGFGCTVPAVMATRILNSEREKKRAILLLPFVSCSAKLPIFFLFANIFFKQWAAVIVYFLYLLSFVIGIAVCFLSQINNKHKKDDYLLIELPEYHRPDYFTILNYVKEKGADYLAKAGSTIFAASVLVWLLLHVGYNGYTATVSESFAARVGQMLAPFLSPAGLGEWQIVVALIAGFSAKEVVISSLSVLFKIQNLNSAIGADHFKQILNGIGFGSINAFSLMVFCLLYSPCVSALAMIWRETKSIRWMLGIFLLQMIIAWLGAVICYQLGSIIVG